MRDDKVKQATTIVEELGITADNEPELYSGFLHRLESDTHLTAFIQARPHNRRFHLQYAASSRVQT
jgi:hypothetical protein